MTQITGEVVLGSGTSFTLAHPPVSNTLALYGSGIRLTNGVDYSQSGSTNSIITILSGSYTSGTVTADYQTNDNSGITTQVGVDVLSPFALTTLQRVKDILFDPNKTILLTGATLTNGSETVTAFTIPTGRTVVAGQQISGVGILTGTTIAGISGNTITLSQNCVTSNTGQTLTVVDQTPSYDAMIIRYINWATNLINNYCGVSCSVQKTFTNDTYSIDNPRQTFLVLRHTPVFSISSFQWRAGTPTNPSWTDFIADQYELIDPETDPVSGTVWYPKGTIRVYGVLPRIYSNMIRCTYVAGYPVDWNNPENHTTHWLPSDLTNVCENLVVRRFKRRMLAGQGSQNLEGATTSWRDKLDSEDTMVLDQYKQLNW
jgi:hypothetical protein